MANNAADISQVTATKGLSIQALHKSYRHTSVLDGINLDVNQGELVTVLGPSGSGKTTLLRLICGFEQPDSGHIILGGHRVSGHGKHLPPEKRGIGYVAQEGALFPHLTVADNLLFGLLPQQKQMRHQEKIRHAAELLELVGLPPHYAKRKPAMLSGGEQQRVALARALAPRPSVVLLDEPFSALDASLRAELRHVILSSLKKVNTTALLVTHDQAEALSLGDRVAVLHNHRFAQVADPQTLYHLPANQAVASFVGEAVFSEGRIDKNQVECDFGRLAIANNTPDDLTGAVTAMIRPEQFKLKQADGPGTPDSTDQKAACVESMTFYGNNARLTLRLPNKRCFPVTVSGMNVPASGSKVLFKVAGPVMAYKKA